jgi:hypothetical protein
MKKRNKKHMPKMVLIPKIIPRITALQAYPDLANNIATINQMSHELCVIAGAMSYESNCKPLLGRKDMEALAIMSAIKVLESIVDRHDRTGKVFVSELEGKSLDAAVKGIHSVLSRIGNNSYETALHEVDGYINEMKRIAA